MRQVDCPMKTITNPILALQKMSANDLQLSLDVILAKLFMGQKWDASMNQGTVTTCSFDLITSYNESHLTEDNHNKLPKTSNNEE